MRRIGYWIQSVDDERFTLPQELVGELDQPVREKVAQYLDRGYVFARYRGISWCRFLCGTHSMGSCELSDGVWVWPEGLSHYVRQHGVILPEEFMAFSDNQSIPPVSGPTSTETPADDSYWIQWCAAHRSHSHDTRKKAVIDEAEGKAAEVRASAVKEKEANVGLSNSLCSRPYCKNLALSKRKLCASHTLESIESPTWRIYDLRKLLTTE